VARGRSAAALLESVYHAKADLPGTSCRKGLDR